jgi:hypothetical protein
MRVSLLISFESISAENRDTSKSYEPGRHSTRGADQSCWSARSRARSIYRSCKFPAGYTIVSTGRRSSARAADSSSTWNAARSA